MRVLSNYCQSTAAPAKLLGIFQNKTKTYAPKQNTTKTKQRKEQKTKNKQSKNEKNKQALALHSVHIGASVCRKPRDQGSCIKGARQKACALPFYALLSVARSESLYHHRPRWQCPANFFAERFSPLLLAWLAKVAELAVNTVHAAFFENKGTRLAPSKAVIC